MIKKYLKRLIIINKEAILMEVLSIKGLMQLLMKTRNTDEKCLSFTSPEVPSFCLFLQKPSIEGKLEGYEKRRCRVTLNSVRDNFLPAFTVWNII
jgi:hypothetical protein